MCKKQTSVSHCSTEAEVISLDAGLRMDGIPALDLEDLVIEVLHSSPNQTNKARDPCRVTGKPVAEHNAQNAEAQIQPSTSISL